MRLPLSASLFSLGASLLAGCGSPILAPSPTPISKHTTLQWAPDRQTVLIGDSWIFWIKPGRFSQIQQSESSRAVLGFGGTLATIDRFTLSLPDGRELQIPLWLKPAAVPVAVVRMDTSNHCVFVSPTRLYCDQEDTARGHRACGLLDLDAETWSTPSECLLPSGARLVHLSAGFVGRIGAIAVERGQPTVRIGRIDGDSITPLGAPLHLWRDDLQTLAFGQRGQSFSVVSRCALHQPGRPCPSARGAKGFPPTLFSISLRTGEARRIRKAHPFAAPVPSRGTTAWTDDGALCFDSGMGPLCHHPAHLAGH